VERPHVGGHQDLPTGGHSDGTAVTESERIPCSSAAGFAPNADYFVLSMPCFAARGWLRINLLCVLGEVISERVADLVHGV
jgi:hypothetical protein